MTPEEFARLYLPLGDGFYQLALRLLDSQEDAEDAVQDLYVKLLSDRERLDTVQDPKAWGYVLLRNLCVDRIRSRGARPQEAVSEALAAEAPEEPPERLERALAAVRSLSDADRSLVRLRLVHDLPYDEIARRTGKTELALRVAFYRIKNKIRKKI